jgi:polar amino acid transport system substrate-binding protein
MVQFIETLKRRCDRSLQAVLIGALSLVCLGIVAKGAAADTLADVKKAGVLMTGTEMQFPPFDFLENTEYRGINRDLIDQVAKELGVKAQYLDLPWTSVLPGLEAKKFDLVIAPVTINKERMKRYAFTLPISEATVALMKRAGDTSITKPQDIAGKTVGGQKGTSQLEQLKVYAKTLPKPVEVKEYVDNNQASADLAAGRIDATVNSLPNLAFAAAQRSDAFALVLPPFGQPTYFSWVGRQGETDASLMKAIDAALIKIENDGRMAAIQKKWFGKDFVLPQKLPEPSF